MRVAILGAGEQYNVGVGLVYCRLSNSFLVQVSPSSNIWEAEKKEETLTFLLFCLPYIRGRGRPGNEANKLVN